MVMVSGSMDGDKRLAGGNAEPVVSSRRSDEGLALYASHAVENKGDTMRKSKYAVEFANGSRESFTVPDVFSPADVKAKFSGHVIVWRFVAKGFRADTLLGFREGPFWAEVLSNGALAPMAGYNPLAVESRMIAYHRAEALASEVSR